MCKQLDLFSVVRQVSISPLPYDSNDNFSDTHTADIQETVVPQQQLFGESYFAPESPPLQPVPHLDQDPGYHSSAPGSSSEDVKKELKMLLEMPQHFDELIELASSLTKNSKGGLLRMDTEGLVEVLFEAINKVIIVDINIKNVCTCF